jgi:hypothetical protein
MNTNRAVQIMTHICVIERVIPARFIGSFGKGEGKT